MVYIYTIMTRTQIYLSEAELAALRRQSKKTGKKRSQLIRDAILACYIDAPDAEASKRALAATAGLWRGRVTTGEAYVDELRSGALARKLAR